MPYNLPPVESWISLIGNLNSNQSIYYTKLTNSSRIQYKIVDDSKSLPNGYQKCSLFEILTITEALFQNNPQANWESIRNNLGLTGIKDKEEIQKIWSIYVAWIIFLAQAIQNWAYGYEFQAHHTRACHLVEKLPFNQKKKNCNSPCLNPPHHLPVELPPQEEPKGENPCDLLPPEIWYTIFMQEDLSLRDLNNIKIVNKQFTGIATLLYNIKEKQVKDDLLTRRTKNFLIYFCHHNYKSLANTSYIDLKNGFLYDHLPDGQNINDFIQINILRKDRSPPETMQIFSTFKNLQQVLNKKPPQEEYDIGFLVYDPKEMNNLTPDSTRAATLINQLQSCSEVEKAQLTQEATTLCKKWLVSERLPALKFESLHKALQTIVSYGL